MLPAPGGAQRSAVAVLACGALAAALSAASCSDGGAPGTGTAIQASIGFVQVVACTDPAVCGTAGLAGSITETATFATNTGRNGAGTWEMIATGNSSNGHLQYGCTRNNYASWKTFDFSTVSEGDTTGAYDSVDGFTYIASFGGPAGHPFAGLRVFWSSDPCPAAGNPAWSSASWQFTPDGVDHPTFVYDPIYNKKYIVWTETVPGGTALAVGWIDSSNALHTSYSACSNYHGAALVPSAAADLAGNVHIVYLDTKVGTDGFQHITHETFLQNAGGYACQNNVIGNYVWPAANCATCSNGNDAKGHPIPVATWPNVGNSCIRANPAPSIAIDNSGTPNLVVTYGTMSTDSNCGTAETYIYRSTGYSGASWSWIYRSCAEAIFPRVATGTMPGGPSAPGLFHIVTDVEGNGGFLAPYDLKSTDGGVTWQTGGTGWLVTNSFYPTPVPGFTNCYAGDYEGATPDLAHGRFFYAWGQPYEGTTWAIEGNTNDP